MTQLYDIQQEILNYFQERKVDSAILDQKAQDEIGVYRSLVLNGMEDIISNVFPYCYQLLEPNWREIVKDYQVHHMSESAIYNRLSKDFPKFLSSENFKHKAPNYIAELALYEWLEVEIYNAADAKEKTKLCPIHKITNFKYPVSQIIEYIKSSEETIEEIRETDIEEEDELVLIFRDRNHKVRFFVLSAASHFVIEGLTKNQSETEIFQAFCENFNQKPEEIQDQYNALLQNLRDLGILLE